MLYFYRQNNSLIASREEARKMQSQISASRSKRQEKQGNFVFLLKTLLKFFVSHLLLSHSLSGALIRDKVLICGICRDIEKAIPNSIYSIEKLGSQFQDYHVVIYENNSRDRTKTLLKKWADSNSHVTFLSENLTPTQLRSPIHNKKMKRTEAIARARNKVIDRIMLDKFEDYKYVVWADLDFLNPWDIKNITDSINNPEYEWDGIFANGAYDLYAYRDVKFPIGPELIGKIYWDRISEIAANIALDQQDSWRKVYSGFGGLAIYKRESIKGCYYSGFVTKDQEATTHKWLEIATPNTFLLEEYRDKLATSAILSLKKYYRKKNHNGNSTGIRLCDGYGAGSVVWFSSSKKCLLPTTCEHIPFHASMAARGHDKLYINPRLISVHPHLETCSPM